jgi:Sec-independent protein translocase protein TatA
VNSRLSVICIFLLILIPSIIPDSASPLSNAIRPSQSQFNRKNSVDSESSQSINSNKQTDGNAASQAAKRDRRVRPRSSRRNERDFFAVTSNNVSGKENNCDEDEQRRPESNGQEVPQGGRMTSVPANTFVNKERKEDYW